MRRSTVIGATALVLVLAASGTVAGAKEDKNADPVFERLEDSFTNEAFHDCGTFQVGYDLTYVSELVTWDDRQLGRFDHRYEYWRSTDRMALGVGEVDQTALYELGKKGELLSYTLAGPATYTLADGQVLEQSGAQTFGPDGTVIWQEGEHPDFQAALCEVGEAL
jgi:hypothetical protein